MKWTEYQKLMGKKDSFVEHYERTNIECPRCGEHILRRADIILTTYPPQRQYVCKSCGWCGTGY